MLLFTLALSLANIFLALITLWALVHPRMCFNNLGGCILLVVFLANSVFLWV